MKQFLFGLFALILAFGAVAFTKAGKSPKSNTYWFQLDASGNQITLSSPPASMANDPYGCLTTASQFCSREYGSYEVVPGSSPTQYRGVVSSAITTHKKN